MQTTLDNGLLLISHPLTNAHRVTLGLFLPSGALHDPAGQAGISHLAEHLCFRSPAGETQADFYRRIESIGGHLRAATYLHHTVFELTVLPRHFGAALDIVYRLFPPNDWTNEDVRREKAIIQQERRGQGFDYCRELLRRYDRRSAILGSESSVTRLTKPQIQQRKTQMFRPEGAVMVITGQLSENDLQSAQERLAAIPVSPLSAPAKRWRQPARFRQRGDRKSTRLNSSHRT